ncbi:MAG: amino acid adenylation domain-containing protein [Halanaerobiales bacterium]|nr:amino acid adenylation domain-containing protein [Halanaerobiales bacterium]
MGKGAEIEKIYSLSPMQEGMLYYYLVDQDSDLYFEQTILALDESLDLEILQESFNKLIERHEVFRTIFVFQNIPTPKQVVLKQRRGHVIFEDISYLTGKEQKAYLDDFKRKDKSKTFDLSKDVLLRITLLKIGASRCKLVWSHHHIIMDGWCTGIVIQELFQIYASLKQGKSKNLPSVQPFSSYINWLKQQSEEMACNYWQERLSDYENTAVFPTDPKKGNEFIRQEYDFVVERGLVEKLDAITKEHQITMNTIFQTVWGIMLQRYNNTDDVIFGSVVSGRNIDLPGIVTMVGLFINTIPVRIKTKKNDTFITLLKRTQNDFVQSNKYSYISLAKIQAESELKNNLINHIVAFENYPLDSMKIPVQINLDECEIFEQINYDLGVTVVPGDELLVRLTYNQRIYETDLIKNLGVHFKNIMSQVVEDVDVKLSKIKVLTDAESDEVLYRFNETKGSYPADQTIHKLFEEQVEKTSENIAVTYEERQISYRVLNERANQLARTLKTNGVNPNSIIGIMADRSIELVIGILAILKAGGAYLPIDVEYPADRIDYILKDSNTEILLTNKDIASNLAFTGTVFDLQDESLYQGDTSNLEKSASYSDLVYIIYTSGTTGKPKGVMVEHRGLVNYIWWAAQVYTKGERANFPLYTSISFDLTVTSIFTPMITGNTIVVYEAKQNQFLIQQVIRDNKVDVVKLTPSHFKLLRYENLKDSHVKRFILGGENLETNLAKDIYDNFAGKIEILNEYGPTETVVGCMIYKYDPMINTGKSVPLGVPGANVQIYLLDKNLHPVPTGVCGELYIGGEGVARGYLNKPELTKEKFVENPFHFGERLYRTGDLAKRLPDGNIEFVGRIDKQVKIRGFRIELKEINNKLVEHPDIKEAVVISRKDEDGVSYICAYIITEHSPVVAELRTFLATDLPDYMIPAYFVQLEEMPLNRNGKIDEKELPEPHGEINTGIEYVAPRNNIEEKLVGVWQQVLKVEKVGINDDFFALGGDSIKGIQISSRLQKYNLRFDLKNLMDYPTIAVLSYHVQTVKNIAEQGIVQGPVMLTPIQKRFIEEDVSLINHFNQSMMLFNKDGFDEQLVKRTFEKLIEHHDALRMVLIKTETEIRQINSGLEGNLLELQVYDFSDDDKYNEKIKEKSLQLNGSINLNAGPLVKLGLFKTDHGTYLLIIIHHLVVDGISWRILLEDFAGVYLQLAANENATLPAKTTSFKEWSEKLNDFANSDKFLKEKEYWKKFDSLEIPVIPTDYDSKENKISDTEMVSSQLSKSDSEHLLKNVNKVYSTEINDILLASLALTVSEWGKVEHVLINLESHGREEIMPEIDLTRTVGWFTSVYPVIFKIEKDADIAAAIKNTKEKLRSVQNKGIGYGILRYLTAPEKNQDLKFRLEPEICFNYLGQFDKDEDAGLYQLVDMFSDGEVHPEFKRPHILNITGIMVDGILEIVIDYSKKQYDRNTIIEFAEKYKANLIGSINHCINKDETEMTLSDYTEKNLTEVDVDQFFDELEDAFS